MRFFQAITTKFLPATNTRGSRIKATAAAGSLTVARDCALNIEQNHARAAEMLANKFKWKGRYYGGGLPDEKGYCFVCSDDEASPAFTCDGEG